MSARAPASGECRPESQSPPGTPDPLGRIVLGAERLRSGAVAAFFAGLAVLIVFSSAVQDVPVERSVGALAFGLTLLVSGFEAWLAWSAHRRIQTGRGPSWVLPYVATVLEVGTLVAGPVATGPVDAAGFEGGLAVLFVLLAFSVVRMRLPVTAFTGVAVAAGYVALAEATPAAPTPGRLWVALVIVASGLGLGLMARAFRRGATVLVAEREARERLQADLLASVEATQAAIGRELHDSVGSHLTGLSMVARGLVRRLDRGGRVKPAEAADVADLVDEALRQVRRLSRGLTPSEMEPGGLPSALRDLAASATHASDLDVAFVDGLAHGAGGLSHEAEAQLYRIAQEAVSNALRHAGASHLTVRLGADGGAVTLAVEDDGRGIADAARGGVGLRTMRHRADLVGGTVDVEARPAGGTVVSARVPTEP